MRDVEKIMQLVKDYGSIRLVCLPFNPPIYLLTSSSGQVTEQTVAYIMDKNDYKDLEEGKRDLTWFLNDRSNWSHMDFINFFFDKYYPEEVADAYKKLEENDNRTNNDADDGR